jgi:hypothetical protein
MAGPAAQAHLPEQLCGAALDSVVLDGELPLALCTGRAAGAGLDKRRGRDRKRPLGRAARDEPGQALSVAHQPAQRQLAAATRPFARFAHGAVYNIIPGPPPARRGPARGRVSVGYGQRRPVLVRAAARSAPVKSQPWELAHLPYARYWP